MLVTRSTTINSVLITSVTVLDSKSICRQIAPPGSEDITPTFVVPNHAMPYGIMLAVRLRCQVLNAGGTTSDGTWSHSAPAHSAGALATRFFFNVTLCIRMVDNYFLMAQTEIVTESIFLHSQNVQNHIQAHIFLMLRHLFLFLLALF